MTAQDPADARFHLLNRRHRECLRLVYNRKVTKEIAAELGLGVGTVSTYCTEAIRIVGARNRVDAAEQLHAWEASRPGEAVDPAETTIPDRPSEVEPLSGGVPSHSVPAAILATPHDGADWRRLVPLRRKGALGNDLSVLERIEIIFVGAVLLAIGFGAVAGGLRIISDLLRAVFRR